VTDPYKGPGIVGWDKYDVKDPKTLALLGVSVTGAVSGNHTEVDAVCEYWNTILPIFPQVSSYLMDVFVRICDLNRVDVPRMW
jgi:hypothetical protein